MRFAVLGSGSRGNGLVIEAGGTCLLVDCGFSVQELGRRLAQVGRCLGDLSAVLVTHEHGDHVQGVAALARQRGLPVWLTAGTARHKGLADVPDRRLFHCHQDFAIGDLQIQPFPVPHDAAEPGQCVFGDGRVRLGLLTDCGSVTPHVEQCLDGVDALVLECNYEPVLLEGGDYPPALKRRVGGSYGHLSNAQAAALLGRIDTSCLQHVLAAHLSEKNNTPGLARAALADALGAMPGDVAVATQDQVLPWREIT
ncbi:MAG TPA: MBL fold metallo-hydrolase [Gammaproteobacteria bacterium]|nr:MBL fold metallo-hydrolase [Gammaproteobacteria bacterium]